jgi:hypothetical protein
LQGVFGGSFGCLVRGHRSNQDGIENDPSCHPENTEGILDHIMGTEITVTDSGEGLEGPVHREAILIDNTVVSLSHLENPSSRIEVN